MDLGLAGKVAVVTGATSNIGRSIALALAEEGARVVVVGRDEQAGARVVEAARAGGKGDALFVRADMLDPASPDRILAEAARLGPLSILVNNVGGNVGAGLFADTDPASWQGDIDLNFTTLLRMTHAALPALIEGKGGRIVNIGSTAGIVGDYMLAVYSAAKSAVHGFTRVLAKEVGRHGITVNCVAPYGTIASDPDAFSSGSRFHAENDFFRNAFRDADPEDMARRSRSGPLARQLARPEEVAAAVLYLASRQAEFVTGQIMRVDGGTLL